MYYIIRERNYTIANNTPIPHEYKYPLFIDRFPFFTICKRVLLNKNKRPKKRVMRRKDRCGLKFKGYGISEYILFEQDTLAFDIRKKWVLKQFNKTNTKFRHFNNESTPEYFKQLHLIENNRCLWCGEELQADSIRGRRRYYCSNKCKLNDTHFKKAYAKMKERANPDYILKNYRVPYSYDNVSPPPWVDSDKWRTLEREFILFELDTDYNSYGYTPHKTIMSLYRGNCKNCGGIISPNKQMSAQFCSDECRYEYHNKRKNKQ